MKSMIVAAYHLGEAQASIAVAEAHIRDAMAADPDGEAIGLYSTVLNNLTLVSLYCEARRAAGGPDIEREVTT